MSELDYREINRLAANPEEMIKAAELQYHTHINSLAKRISDDPGVRIILLAGPSGSGKTTTANLLADELTRLGEKTIAVSLDDFYKDSNDPSYPKTPSQEIDYECPEALHLDEITSTLRRVARGEAFEIPKYDFKVAAQVSKKEYPPMPHGCLIIEGLHALNPKISDALPRESILKLFVSVSTNISDGEDRILSGKKLRFVRRMVRDSIYRASNARRTLDMWQNVLKAEDVYLYPYKETADVTFDTFHIFEPSVMAPFAKRLIDGQLEIESEYAKTIVEALRKITPIDAHLVPENSLIKEFIPGGIYESLY